MLFDLHAGAIRAFFPLAAIEVAFYGPGAMPDRPPRSFVETAAIRGPVDRALADCACYRRSTRLDIPRFPGDQGLDFRTWQILRAGGRRCSKEGG